MQIKGEKIISHYPLDMILNIYLFKFIMQRFENDLTKAPKNLILMKRTKYLENYVMKIITVAWHYLDCSLHYFNYHHINNFKKYYKSKTINFFIFNDSDKDFSDIKYFFSNFDKF